MRAELAVCAAPLLGAGACRDSPTSPAGMIASGGCENGTTRPFDGWSSSGTVEVGPFVSAIEGSEVCRLTLAGGVPADAATLEWDHRGQPANRPGGVYERWSFQVTAGLLSAVQGGQIKLQLDRGGSNPPSWLHIGIGPEFAGCGGTADEIHALRDYDTNCLPDGQTSTGVRIVAGRWYEIATHYERSNGVGRARMWIDGDLLVDVSDPDFGTDGSNDQTWEFGMVYSQGTKEGTTMTMYVDAPETGGGLPVW